MVSVAVTLPLAGQYNCEKTHLYGGCVCGKVVCVCWGGRGEEMQVD